MFAFGERSEPPSFMQAICDLCVAKDHDAATTARFFVKDSKPKDLALK